MGNHRIGLREEVGPKTAGLSNAFNWRGTPAKCDVAFGGDSDRIGGMGEGAGTLSMLRWRVGSENCCM